MKHYIVSVQIYSGRPDPVWEIPVETGKTLESNWEYLEPYTGEFQKYPRLGYSGCKLLVENGVEFLAFSGVVAKSESGKVELRADQKRIFEKTIFDTAPPGIIPEDLSGF